MVVVLAAFITEFVSESRGDTIHSDVIQISGAKDGTEYEIALQYSTEFTEKHSVVRQ